MRRTRCCPTTRSPHASTSRSRPCAALPRRPPMAERILRATAALAAALALAACTPAPPAGWSGYVEGEYVYVGSALGGTLTALHVQAGQDVAEGAPLFALDPEAERAASDEAKARLVAAQA